MLISRLRGWLICLCCGEAFRVNARDASDITCEACGGSYAEEEVKE